MLHVTRRPCAGRGAVQEDGSLASFNHLWDRLPKQRGADLVRCAYPGLEGNEFVWRLQLIIS